MNFLTTEFQAYEVKQALDQMHPLKALGPDGMSPLFYQYFWPIVEDCVTKTVLKFLNSNITHVRTYVFHMLRTNVTILFNWLIL